MALKLALMALKLVGCFFPTLPTESRKNCLPVFKKKIYPLGRFSRPFVCTNALRLSTNAATLFLLFLNVIHCVSVSLEVNLAFFSCCQEPIVYFLMHPCLFTMQLYWHFPLILALLIFSDFPLDLPCRCSPALLADWSPPRLPHRYKRARICRSHACVMLHLACIYKNRNKK